MATKKGLVNSVNAVRTLASTAYQQAVPVLTVESGIEMLSAPLLAYPNLMNEFISVLVNKISYSQLVSKMYNNPLKFLEGDNLPLGAIGEEIYINPAIGRNYDINDFSGLLKKYEADVKVQYQEINLDKQYPVTIIRQELKKAFSTWGALEEFITNITTSLYNGAYIDQYNATKNLVTNAYRQNAVQIEILNGINTKELAEAFVEKARTLFLNFQSPSNQYNAWHKVGGYGRDIISWSLPDDIVFLIRNDIQAKLDVQVLAKAFNVDSTALLGRIVPVDNFNIVDKNYNVIFDGSKILGMIADKSWFRIKEQDMYMEDFRNANNRSLQYYLNVIKMYKYSYFANAVVFAEEAPKVTITGVDLSEEDKTVTIKENESKIITAVTTPVNGTTPELTFESSDNDSTNYSVEKIGDKQFKITGKKQGSGTVTIKAGNAQVQASVTIETAE